jgi:hypothetical protein
LSFDALPPLGRRATQAARSRMNRDVAGIVTELID